jgi:hypothetical protein
MSTRVDEAMDAVRTRVQSEIVVAQSVTVIFDNDDTKEPNNALHIRWRFLELPGLITATGGDSATIRTRGLCRAKIKAPFGTGTDAQLGLMQAVLEAFRAQTVSGVTYYAPFPGASFKDGAWWVRNVEIPWESHENT